MQRNTEIVKYQTEQFKMFNIKLCRIKQCNSNSAISNSTASKVIILNSGASFIKKELLSHPNIIVIAMKCCLTTARQNA